jgi:uncharacterized membrane protein
LKQFDCGENVYSELIVLVITGQKGIDEVGSFFEMNYGEGLFTLIDIVQIDRDTTGKNSYQMLRQESDRTPDKYCCLGAAFAEIMLDISQNKARRQLADAGLDPFFMCKVNQVLIPGSKAYLLYIPSERLVDSRSVLEILGELQGGLFHTIFRPQVEEVLLKLIL